MSRYFKRSSLITNFRFYSSPSQQAADNYVARMIPKRILKASEQVPNFESEAKVEQISEAVQRYLTSYKKNVDFFADQNKEYELGKRHLANIMGYDPENITQEQIDVSKFATGRASMKANTLLFNLFF